MIEFTQVFRCRWLVQPAAEPRQNVRISVEKNVVAEICDVPADERSLVEPIALLPQFVNAHTHLEFSDLSEPLPPPAPFTDWVGSVIRHRSQAMQQSGGLKAAVLEGLSETNRSGTSIVGEIATSEEGIAGLSDAKENGQTVIAFRELLGFTADRVHEQLEAAREFLAVDHGGSICHGLSPHAPYSVHPDLFESAVDLAREHQCPVAMHLAETRGELEFLDRQSGIFRELLESLSLWSDDILKPGTAILSYLQHLADLPNALAIHGNYLTNSEISFLGEHQNVAVVYCPRTHAWFGHSGHPWQRLRDAGARVILGTDSRASNPDLSIWKELQLVARQVNSLAVWQLLPMITTEAAAALGVEDAPAISVGRPFSAVSLPCDCGSLSQLNQSLLAEECQPTRIS